ncbi:MAG: SDR family NAD(P)-dependent oxidoreductase [Rhodomicrobiaceae bacterium]
MRLEGKRAVITGAGSGIGRALAIEAAGRGIRLALTGRRREALQQTLAKLPGAGHFAVAGDVTSPADRASLMGAIEARWGGLDLLVNNAGLVPVGPLAKITDDELHAVVATNLLAPMALVRLALPLLRRGQAARVVNIGSVLGDIPYPLFAAYSASKSGLRGFSTALRRELAPLGVGVTYAAPRATRTAASRPLQALIEPFKMKLDSPRAVAVLVWKAVAREADSAYPAGPERLFVLIQRLLPQLVDRSIAKQLGKVGAV